MSALLVFVPERRVAPTRFAAHLKENSLAGLGMVILCKAAIAELQFKFLPKEGAIARVKELKGVRRVTFLDNSIEVLRNRQAKIGFGNLDLRLAVGHVFKDEPSTGITAGLNKDVVSNATTLPIALHAPFRFPELKLPIKAGCPEHFNPKGITDGRFSGFAFRANAVVVIVGTSTLTRWDGIVSVALMTYEIPFTIGVAITISFAQTKGIGLGRLPVRTFIIQLGFA